MGSHRTRPPFGHYNKDLFSDSPCLPFSFDKSRNRKQKNISAGFFSVVLSLPDYYRQSLELSIFVLFCVRLAFGGIRVFLYTLNRSSVPFIHACTLRVYVLPGTLFPRIAQRGGKTHS